MTRNQPFNTRLPARTPRTRGIVGACAACSLVLPALAAAQNLAPQDRLEEIIVTASIIETPRREIGTAVSVIEGSEIELRGYHSVADVLRTQPGIGVSTSGGHGKNTNLRIRGEDHWRTLLMIDGIKTIDPSSTQAAPVFDSLLTTSDLERVEILRGPQGFIYGADAGGVVNIMTRRGEGDFAGRVGLEYGRYATRNLEASIAAGNETADYYISVTDFETDGFNAQTADTAPRDDDGAENTTLHARLGWNPTERLRLQLVARDIDAFSEFDGCWSTTTFDVVHDCTGTIEQTTYRISADHDAGTFRNSFAYSNVDVTRENFSEGVPSFGTEGEISRFEYTGSTSRSDAATIVYGVDVQRERMVGDERSDRQQRGYYVEYQGAFHDRFYLQAGLRYDNNEDFGTHTSVRVSGAYVLDLPRGNTLKYRASYGTGFRAPSLYELAFNRGAWAAPPASATTLREERSRGYDVGIEYSSSGGLDVQLAYFDQKLADEIFWDSITSSGYLQSFGTSRSQGVEIAARVAVSAAWQVFGNWTYNQTLDTDHQQRLRRPRNLGNVGVAYTAPDQRLRVAANYRLSRDSIDVGNVALDNYAVLDLSASFVLTGRLELQARIENANDERYQEIIGYNTPRRAAYAGVRLRF